MAGNKKFPQYLLEEPTTGLYIIPGGERPVLTDRAALAAFSSVRAAVLGAQSISDQPHELVRVDA